MNLKQFLNKVDNLVTNLPAGHRAALIHIMAQDIPENKRDQFLTNMKNLASGSTEDVGKIIQQNDSSLKERLDQIRDEMQKIHERDICLLGEINENYDDYYSPEEDEFLFEDPDELLPILQRACNLVHACIDGELYQEAYELGNELYTLEIGVNGEYIDEYMYFKEVLDYKLIKVDFYKLSLEILYAAYKSIPLKKRAEKLYKLIEDFKDNDITLEEIFNVDNTEIGDREEFLNIWIDYIGKIPMELANRLFLQSVDMLKDVEVKRGIAKKFVNQHPRLYVNLINDMISARKYESVINLGNEALKNIPISYKIRSEAALLSVRAAMAVKNFDEAEKFRLEAFRSNTTPENFLQIVVKSKDFSKWRNEARNIYTKFVYNKSVPFADYDISNGDLQQNNIEELTFQALRFFDGYFEETIKTVMYPEKPVGWSQTFIKQAMAIFLVVMYRGAALQSGCNAMCKMAKDKGLINGVKVLFSSSSPTEKRIQDFYQIIKDWQKNIPMSEDIQRKALDRIEKLVEQRTDGIVGNKINSHYSECAAFIAAFGEVKESWNEGSKQNIMDVYGKRYPRHSAFRRELQSFGWKKNNNK